MNSIDDLLKQLRLKPDTIHFSQVMAVIDECYDVHPSGFSNGELANAKEENQGSCKLFAFAKLQGLTKEQTLSLFAEHYENVLSTPDGEAHQNIRQFMTHGWDGVKFEHFPLQPKPAAQESGV